MCFRVSTEGVEAEVVSIWCYDGTRLAGEHRHAVQEGAELTLFLKEAGVL